MLDVVRGMEKLHDGNALRLVCNGNPTVALAVSDKTLATQLLNDRRLKAVPGLQVTKCFEARTDEVWKDVVQCQPIDKDQPPLPARQRGWRLAASD